MWVSWPTRNCEVDNVTAVPRIMRANVGPMAMPKPTMFDMATHYEPSAHFKFSRRVRNEFEALARDYSRNTWLMGRYGGKPVMQTDIQGIGVGSRVEIGRLSLREGNQGTLLHSAFEFFRECGDRGLASGPIDRILVHFSKADHRPRQREILRQVFGDVFDGDDCSFLACEERDLLEMGRCVAYQSLVQYLREDGLYHSVHRGRIEALQRHLHQEVGRYENHQFYVRPEAAEGGVPRVVFCYTGASADRRVEAFVEGYTNETVQYVEPQEFQDHREDYVELGDYERASRRFGGLWILQGDVVRHLMAQQVGVLYLFFNDQMMPAFDRSFTWDELVERQRRSAHINRAVRNSQTFLEMVLEGLVRGGFAEEAAGAFCLVPGFHEFQHVTFYPLGDYRRRVQ